MRAIPWAFLCMRPIKKTTQGAGGENGWGNQKKSAGNSHNAIKNVATETRAYRLGPICRVRIYG